MKDFFKYNWEQMSTRQRMSPLPNVNSMEAICSVMGEIVGRAYETVATMFEGNMMYVFLVKEDQKAEGEHLLVEFKKDPEFFSRKVKRIEELSKPFLLWLKNLEPTELQEKTDRELADLWVRYLREYKQIYSNYFSIFSSEFILAEYFKKILRGKTSEEKTSEYFQIMITEPRAMVARQEEIAALKVAKTIKEKGWEEILKLKTEKLREEALKNKPLLDLIRKHEKGYFWITRDYEDPILTFDDILIRLKVLLKNNPAQKLEEYGKEAADLVTERERIKKELGLSEEIVAQFAEMREGLHLKELRKTVVSQSLYYFDKVLSEISRRTSLSLRQLRFLISGEEACGALADAKKYDQILNDRLRKSVFWSVHGETKVFVNDEADEIFKRLLSFDEAGKELKGYAASTGKRTGKARIVMNPDECYKVKKGEVIVTAQAVPSFSSAISISAGLVCDGGTAITSHPATLAREAHIPCVTGTKIATQVIKDGDMLEVDGTNGVVKLL